MRIMIIKISMHMTHMSNLSEENRYDQQTLFK